MKALTEKRPTLGFFVDAGPRVGYGHAVRCLRLAEALEPVATARFYPMSEPCAAFLEAAGKVRGSIHDEFPRVAVTDLRYLSGVTRIIHHRKARHVSIHDLGLAQCHSHIAIDGSVTNLFPYLENAGTRLYAGTAYTITRQPVIRKPEPESVFVTLGGGRTADFATESIQVLRTLGLKVLATCGIGRNPETLPGMEQVQWVHGEDEIRGAMARCTFAISSAGTSLYDLVASGIPTLAVAFDYLQLRTAEAFAQRGGALCAGLFQQMRVESLAALARRLVQDPDERRQLSEACRRLIDGKGLFRVAEIVRRELCPSS